jgi:hypothetical protein
MLATDWNGQKTAMQITRQTSLRSIAVVQTFQHKHDDERLLNALGTNRGEHLAFNINYRNGQWRMIQSCQSSQLKVGWQKPEVVRHCYC